jgi:DeoR family deoxyribose operon repressor
LALPHFCRGIAADTVFHSRQAENAIVFIRKFDLCGLQRTISIPTAPGGTRGLTMSKTDRIELLADALDRRGSMRLRDAATLLGVSEMTVRRDIASSPELACFGGYIVRPGRAPSNIEQVGGDKHDAHSQARLAASNTAARQLIDGETIFIDCGMTLTLFARLIPSDIHITVVCYSLDVAGILRQKPNVRMILLGGVYVPSSSSFASDESIETLRRIGINKAFISADGVDAVRGVTCCNFHEAAIKQVTIASAVACYLVVDASKFGTVRAVRFSQLDGFDSVITENGSITPRHGG